MVAANRRSAARSRAVADDDLDAAISVAASWW
jgi:hypothetical protein